MLHTLDGIEVTSVPPELALYQYGVFTSFVAKDRGVLAWPSHVDRLSRGTLSLWEHRLDQEGLGDLVRDHLARLDRPASVRVTLSPAQFDIVSPVAARGSTTLISSRPTDWPPRAESTFAVCTLDYARDLPEVKSTAILHQIRLRRDAQLAGFDDVLFRRGEHLLEGSTWTLMVWRGTQVHTASAGVLPSVSALCLEGIATRMGRQVQRGPMSIRGLDGADLVLAVSVNHPARAISRLDQRVLPVDEVLLADIAEAYRCLDRDLV